MTRPNNKATKLLDFTYKETILKIQAEKQRTLKGEYN